MSAITPSPLFQVAFTPQFTTLEAWLQQCLAEAGISGAPASRACARVTELDEEVYEIVVLINRSTPGTDLSKLTNYADFDAVHLFPDLAKRADEGIQDLGANIQDELAGIARSRKKELEAKLVKDKPLDAAALQIWQALSACDCIEEVGATVLRLAEAARYFFQTEFLRKAIAAQSGTPAAPLTVPPPAQPDSAALAPGEQPS